MGVLCVGVTSAALYYAGITIGLALKLPNATPSVLWPPNALLTAVLLLTSKRLWPVVLVSVLPVHVWLETAAGWPLGLVLTLWVTNCSEALLAAGGLLWLSDAPTRFNSLRRVGIFFAVAVFAAPFITSFADAAAVSAALGEPFRRVFTARLFSNTLTALVLIPAVVVVATSGWTWLTTA
ncbi:MAG TPA: MASE1 domain-containing protein, partial [Vicinamibacterales bacterium]|nr:MASE1 domain-containing protein [Vicinamibacterales bacterium]